MYQAVFSVFQELIKKDIKVEGLEMEVQALRIHLSKIPPGEELSEEARNLRYVCSIPLPDGCIENPRLSNGRIN